MERADSPVRRQIDEMVRRIVRRFKPDRVILFGSQARGQAGPASDVDLLVVMEVKGSKREAQLAVRRLLHDIPLPKDVIVSRPEEFQWRRNTVGTVEYPAVREGQVVYARPFSLNEARGAVALARLVRRHARALLPPAVTRGNKR